MRFLPALYLTFVLLPASHGEGLCQISFNQATASPAPVSTDQNNKRQILTLNPSTDPAINFTCHLSTVEKALAKKDSLSEKNALIEKFNKCVANAQNFSAPAPNSDLISSQVPAETPAQPPPPPAPAPESNDTAGAPTPGGTTAPAGGNSSGGDNAGNTSVPVATQQLTQGEQLTGSAWGSPDACATGTPGALAAKGILFVHRSLVLPKQASDDFGYRLGKRFLVYQVTVTNAATDFQYSISDIVVDFKPIFIRLPVTLLNSAASDPSTPAAYQASSQDLLMLRGVPEKGQDYDPRNMTLHILQGVGTVGAAVSGLTPFSSIMGSAVANFNGAFIQAFTGIAPDHTATQLNRLSDMAFTSNTLVGKLQTKKFAIFIPEGFVMTKDDQKQYWSDPRTELTKLPFDQLNVCVDGILLVQAAITPDPTFSPTAGNVSANASITLIDSDSGAAIYYTTNGATPTTSSTKYSTPIPTGAAGTQPITIKAFAVSPNKTPSNTVSGVFTPATTSTSPPPAPASVPTPAATLPHK